VSADASVNSVESVNPVTTVTPINPVKSAEQITAESNAEIKADKRAFVAEFGDVPLDEFDGTSSEFRLYGPEDVLPSDHEDAMIDDV
jgi:hypothetical protein